VEFAGFFIMAVRTDASLLRAKPPKGGDAEPRGFRTRVVRCPPSRQRLDHGTRSRVGGFSCSPSIAPGWRSPAPPH